MFSSLSRHAKVEAPAASFNQFLEFHQQMVQAVSDMASIRAATAEIPKDDEPGRNVTHKQEDPQILNEIAHNSMEHSRTATNRTPSKRQPALPHRPAKPSASRAAGEAGDENDENRRPGRTVGCSLIETIKLGKEIEVEAGKWFMDFVERALEAGLRKTKGAADGDVKKVPQSLMLKVVNWIEVEQFDGSKQPLHPKAAQIARKLRIKMKNP